MAKTIIEMKWQREIISIRANGYKVEFTDPDEEVVKQWAKDNRKRLKKEGALNVIHRHTPYEVKRHGN